MIFFPSMCHIMIKEITGGSTYKGQKKCFGYDDICPKLAEAVEIEIIIIVSVIFLNLKLN